MTPDEIDPAGSPQLPDPEAAGVAPSHHLADTGQIPPRRTPRPMQSPPFPGMRPSKRLSADLDRTIGEQGISQELPASPPPVAPMPETGAPWHSHAASPLPQAPHPAAPPAYPSQHAPPLGHAPPASRSPHEQPRPSEPGQQAPSDPYSDLQSQPPPQESPWKWIAISVIAGLVAIGAMIGIAVQH